MHRSLTAALTALAIALIVPAAASAQITYNPPDFYPTSVTTPYPPLAGLEDHPFGFAGSWTTGSPLEADYTDFIAWLEIEDNYYLSAKRFYLLQGTPLSDLSYYLDSGLIGSSSSGFDAGGVDWDVRIIRYVPPTETRLGHYCIYEGSVNGPVLPSGQNDFRQSSRYCSSYLPISEGQ